MKILVTGAAGFIGFHLVKALIKKEYKVIGLDNINDYYDQKLKYERLKELGIKDEKIHETKAYLSCDSNFQFVKADLCNRTFILSMFKNEEFDVVINLAAQAGVRFSIEHPFTYLQSNLEGFLTILEASRHYPVKHLIFASSSSVYGANTKVPFSTNDNVDHPISLYAATKKSNELMAYAYSHLYKIPVTGLRFFTVYGPWGRPDMAYYKFTEAIENNKPIDVYNKGDMYRDFTYIDDIIEGILRLIPIPPQPSIIKGQDEFITNVAYKIYNIGNSKPEALIDLINYIEVALNRKAILNLKEMQPGDVYKTYADVTDLEEIISYKPSTPLKFGISQFVEWYKQWNKTK